MNLTINEMRCYKSTVLPLLQKRVSLGVIAYPRNLFFRQPTNPRVSRYLFEQVSAGKVTGVELAGKRSADGYKAVGI